MLPISAGLAGAYLLTNIFSSILTSSSMTEDVRIQYHNYAKIFLSHDMELPVSYFSWYAPRSSRRLSLSVSKI
jgi:hypothetical protein